MNERQIEDAANQKAIDEYMSSGGKVTVCPAGERSEMDSIASPWNKRKPKAKPKE